MRVMVVGGYGLIGGYVVAALAAGGCEVVGAGRRIEQAQRRFPRAAWITAELATDDGPAWAKRLQGFDAVVNCAGALQDGPGDRLEAVHARGLDALATGATAAGVARLIYISAAGVETSPGAFGRTKREGEAALARHALHWTILRPGLVLAPAAFGGTALLRGLAAFPGFVPVVHPQARVQVVAAQDVARAVVGALRPEAPSRTAIDLVAPGEHRLVDVLQALRAWLGIAPAGSLAFPPALAAVTSLAADAAAWLGWRSPLRSTAIAQLRQGVRGDATGAARLGITLQTLDEILAAAPSGVQERWFSRLYFAKPLAIAGLAAFWIASGAVGAAQERSAADLLISHGMSADVARACVLGGAVVDVALGLTVCVRSWAQRALQGMIGVSAAYLLGATLLRPDLWADPLGPLVKVVPAAILAIATLAVLDER